jgi:hypothetical protein
LVLALDHLGDGFTGDGHRLVEVHPAARAMQTLSAAMRV